MERRRYALDFIAGNRVLVVSDNPSTYPMTPAQEAATELLLALDNGRMRLPEAVRLLRERLEKEAGRVDSTLTDKETQ